MAILENETNNYYKINFDLCSIRGLKVYVNYSAYKTQSERDKEKQRHSLVASFGDNLQKYRAEIYDEFMESVGKIGKEPKDLVASDDKIDAIRFPELRAKQDEIYELEEFIPKFYERLYRYGETDQVAANISENLLGTLIGIGYDENWLSDPICLSMGAEVECGEYSGEEINHELFYNRLKTVMSEDVTDC